MSGYIIVSNAREHNLKNVSVTIPKGRMVVVTGPSGSGKSTLAFDTIFVESQRRYIDSLSTYVRQLLHVYNKPDVDSITGLMPSIAIHQKSVFKSPRSTVATITEIYDYLRLIFASIGVPYSYETGEPIRSYNKTQIIDAICDLPQGRKVHILSPAASDKSFAQIISQVARAGFSRIRVNGVVHDVEDVGRLSCAKGDDVAVVIDRLVLDHESRSRIANDIETALRFNDSTVHAALVSDTCDDYERLMQFPTCFQLGIDGASLEKIEPRLFSFNNPLGACQKCNGLGTQDFLDHDLIIENKDWSLANIIDNLDNDDSLCRISKALYQKMLPHAKRLSIPFDKPWSDMNSDFQELVLYGEKDGPGRPFTGLMHMIECIAENHSTLKRFIRAFPCEGCGGYRLNKNALCVKVLEQNIGEVTTFSVLQMHTWLKSLDKKLSPEKWEIVERVVSELMHRVSFLENVGLDYLTMNRETSSLSGGEGQRIKLASQIGSGLTNVLYVLDEPSIGLHKIDSERMIKSLLALRDLGNTVIVVEHDDDVIRAADYIIDMGPQAGKNGGEVMACGTIDEILANPKSITGACIRDNNFIALPKSRRPGNGYSIELFGVSANNLKGVSVAFPLGKFVCVTGVSGGGKSTLVMEVLVGMAEHAVNRRSANIHLLSSSSGFEYIDRVVEINQHPIGRTPRSNPATYTGIFDHIRQLMSSTNEARMRGYRPSRFSFNVKGGRCDDCDGDGVKKIEMHFLPDVYITCERCAGKKYNQETLSVLYKGKSISDILNMTVIDALPFFDHVPLIREKLEALDAVGLGYVHIGQASNTLSGGESQRIKLAKELSKRSTGRTLYILDEPTTGLHTCDVQNLLKMLNGLVDKGNTVVVIEHNMDIIKSADHVIDIGPLGGDRGGRIVASGTPEEIVKCADSVTGRFLSDYLR